MSIIITECPYCGCKNVEPLNNVTREFHCNGCDEIFDAEDVLREEYRHEISRFLFATSEDKPRECDICLENPHAVGVSSNQMDFIDKIFEQECEGIIWFHKEGTSESDWIEFDDMELWELKCILEAL